MDKGSDDDDNVHETEMDSVPWKSASSRAAVDNGVEGGRVKTKRPSCRSTKLWRFVFLLLGAINTVLLVVLLAKAITRPQVCQLPSHSPVISGTSGTKNATQSPATEILFNTAEITTAHSPVISGTKYATKSPTTEIPFNTAEITTAHSPVISGTKYATKSPTTEIPFNTAEITTAHSPVISGTKYATKSPTTEIPFNTAEITTAHSPVISGTKYATKSPTTEIPLNTAEITTAHSPVISGTKYTTQSSTTEIPLNTAEITTTHSPVISGTKYATKLPTTEIPLNTAEITTAHSPVISGTKYATQSPTTETPLNTVEITTPVPQACNCKPTVEQEVAASCLQLRGHEIVDGLYNIKLEEDSYRSQVFCDMTTDGGGWTLVASIHEKDIKRKCDTDDLWSTYLPLDKANFAAKTNWENDMVFGNVLKATTSDYKNSAFFSLNASDVMVWHIPNGVINSLWKTRSSLRYRTTSGFMLSHGGNLGSIFAEYPLTVKSGTENPFLARTANVLNALATRVNNLKDAISNFYSYSYSASTSHAITTTAMYKSPGGNRVIYATDSCPHSIHYDREYRCADTVFGSRKTTPFLSATAISNERRTKTYFQIQVESTRYFRYTSYTESFMQNTTTEGNYKMQYRALQYRYSTHVTVVQFYFLVTNTKDWGSVEPESFSRSTNYKTSYVIRNAYRITGSPSNVVMGYTLLARTSGGRVPNSELNMVAKEILDAISSVESLFRESNGSALSVPVTFDRGTPSEMLEEVPPNLREYVEPGFIQFRVYNATGYPSAFCPGVRTFSTKPEYICIGGVSDDIQDHGTCGDYAGWEGVSSDVIQANRATGFSHAQQDIFSTMLLFIR